MESNFLSEPNVFLLSLVEAIEDELAFYSQDNSGKFVYLSKSAEKVLNHPLELWKSQTLQDAFSDREGNRLQLDVWQMRLVRDGVSIGHSGIIRRLDGFIEDALEETAEEASLAAKVASLTTVERLVIELVVDGHMNKEMAAKLDVAVRTIESRRSRGMVKLQVSSLPQLVQLWVQVRNMEARKRTEQ